MTITDIFNFIAKQTKQNMLKCGEYYNVTGIAANMTKADIIARIEVVLLERHAANVSLRG